MSKEMVHLTLDGHRFKYGGDFDLAHPATSVANIFVDGVLREFTSGPSWIGDTVIKHANAEFQEEFVCQGGKLRLATAVTVEGGQVHDRQIIAVWQGGQYNLLTHLYSATVAEAVGLVNAFQIDERPDGITITARPSVQAEFQARAICAKFVPGLGLVEAKWRGKREVQGLPTWPGAKVPAGELFRDTFHNGDTYFVLVTRTAVVTVVPRPEAVLADVAAGVGNLDVQVLN